MGSWHCHHCITLIEDGIDQCPTCGQPRTRVSRASGPKVPEAVAIQQIRRLKAGASTTVCGQTTSSGYWHWPEDCGGQYVYNVRQEPVPLKDSEERDEMRQLLELGWVRVAPGHFQREIEPLKVMVFGG